MDTATRLLELGPGHGPTVVLGAPGTGKTTLLLRAVSARLAAGLDPSSLLVIAPSRAAAARLRDELSAGSGSTFSEPAVRTWAAYAFDLIRRARLDGYLPHVERPPRLLSGPEQDTLIGQLLAGHAAGITPGPAWPGSLGEAVGTRGFRQEVRELFDRLAEHGVEAGRLHELGSECSVPEWTAAAELYQEYRDLLDLGSAEAFDPAGLITAAAELLEHHPRLLGEERERLRLVVVDDLQEANPAQHRLLSLLARDADLLAFAAPDNVVQGFRGARPDLLARVDTFYGTEARPVAVATLEHSHRMPLDVAEAWGRVARRIPLAAGAAGRLLSHPAGTATGIAARPPEGAADRDTDHGAGTGAAGSVEAHVVESPVHELRLLTHRILEEHLMGGRPLDDIAVIVRNGALVRTVARHLGQQGISVSVPPAELPLRDEPAVRPLLDLLRLGLSGGDATGLHAVESLLTSRYGQSTALDVRRLRQGLRREEHARGGTRGSSELLAGLFGSVGIPEGSGREAAGARRIRRMLDALAEEADRGGATAETALWALWDASGMSGAWSTAALAGGGAGSRADQDLDAVLALFQAAERFVDQLPGATIAQFVDHVLAQDLPMDSLAGRGGSGPSVEVLTPAAAAGREWGLVLIPGLQEGIWPNTRLRGELLHSGALADVVEHGPVALRQRDPASRLRATRADELRSFAAAVSRCRGSLVCVAVDSEDHQPSGFLDLVSPWSPPVETGGPATRPVTRVPRARTLGSLVALLRQAAEAGARTAPAAAPTGPADDSGAAPASSASPGAGQPGPGSGGLDPTARDAAAVLARLATAPVPVRGADPDEWWGLAPATSTGPVTADGHPVKVSPSKVQAALESPLNWFVQAAGGEPATDFARSLGTLVHAIAEDLPDASGEQYLTELDRRWPELDLPTNWETHRDHDRAGSMLRKLAQYTLLMRQAGRELRGRETDFEVEIGDGSATVRLRGVIDRVEAGPDGRPFVVDLKTGKSQPSGKDVDRNPQLASYQAAVRAGALDGVAGLSRDPAGAALVQLGTSTKTPREQVQPAVEGEDWATPLVLEAARAMGAADFLARHDPTRGGAAGSSCRLPSVCPLCTEGRQVTEP
ncbi:ATP-dependent helicase [Zafaria sp. Z1313]|uniref:ATP-dependent helicase n=1 Tax=unclassified Zafaria TaxID=2828765 RepID=UPI002E7A078D|nr:ATP-dependent DNA helicase [Zafaria sp. J156]MEE1620353.1 ATP-dependent DNA helicase [Zafaria sp. J156]